MNKKTLVVVDLSHMVQCCWHPALSAEKAGREALMAHALTCALCRVSVPIDPAEGREVIEQCAVARTIPQYDPQRVLLTNLDMKLSTLREALGVEPDRFVYAKDDHAEWKKALFANYKVSRKKNKEKYDPRPLAEGHLRAKHGGRFVMAPGNEADDALATLVRREREAWNIIVVSSDRDIWQVLDEPEVRVYDPIRKRFITTENIEKAFDVTEPRHIRLVKALWGDTGDDVPNAVPRMQKQLLPLIKASDGTLDNFRAQCQRANLTEKCQKLLHEGMAQVVINYKLVGLNPELALDWED